MQHNPQIQTLAPGRSQRPAGRDRPRPRWAALLTTLAILACSSAAWAQLPIPASSQFTIVGFLDNATLDDPLNILSGGTVKVNGQLIIVPTNTIVEMPAGAFTWQELFAKAPAPYGIPGSLGVTATVPECGLSLSDTNGTPAPLATYEFTVQGNRLIDVNGDRWIAGLIYISQASLNSGQGFINFIDYVNAEMRVGGTLGVATNGVRVRINDPIITAVGDPAVGQGRYSRGQSPDPRFTCDQDNPTITSQTGYPMGLPVTDPAAGDDPMRPIRNRPLNGNPAFATDGTIPIGAPLANFTMPDPALVTATSPTPWIEAPFKVGDYITYSGTLIQDGDPTRGPTTGPLPTNGAAGTYVSAHTINNNVAIYTAPGTTPAYVIINVMLVGTGGNLIAGVAEATARTRFEGFTSDATPISATTGLSTNNVHFFALDVDPITGVATRRDWGSQDVDPGPPTGAAKGRWRHRPPGSVLTHPAAGAYAPPTREMLAVLSSGEVKEGTFPQPQNFTLLPTLTTTNGLVSGQYRAPIFTYLFPEQILGNPIPPLNLETLDFLAKGIGPLAGPGSVAGANNPIVGQLAPFPAIPTPGAPVAPPPGGGDVVTIASVVYRAGQQRLTVTATSSAGAAATLTLQAVPALNVPTTVFTPVLGIPTASIAGVKTPSTTQLFTVTSNLGGRASSAVTLFR